MEGRDVVNSQILGLIGNTPFLKLNKRLTRVEANIYVKLEFLNPSGSIKDRIALHMINEAEKRGDLKPGYTILEASTGNTAIALSFVGRAKGYKVQIFMPEEVGEKEKLKIMKLYGAEITLVPTGHNKEGKAEKSVHGGNIEIIPRKKCLKMESENPDCWWARQFSNPDNSGTHREYTAREIIEQTPGNIDAFIASVGTGGTLLGIGEALKEKDSRVKIFGVEPAGFPWIQKGREGIDVIDGVAGGLLLDLVDMVDDVFVVGNEDAVKMANQLVLKESFLCGMSAGANVHTAIQIARQYPSLKNIVTVLPDRRDRYFSIERYTT